MILYLKRNLSFLLTAIAVFFIALAKAFHLGKKSERQKQVETALKRATTRFEVENEVNQKSDSGVRAALSRWMRDK
ncbi:hypothetical protein [Bartonella raoultii]|uniref:Phage protein n=1 Tax=Bartonella raoultii TaxID=1457020 RepID=A0ABS7I805_9HYPH|nr:hypothetical protein [Bartonella raoultii]MBX4335527.1 hypothetical protein [Bartonella raoultii]MBX4335621.1 hypothetical protein [Bartonella raoultii]MBX4335695.1 hypothetical protein [Bartonella raoultii]MBX4336515.1 hypothetical protein [Bartonella raoultii]